MKITEAQKNLILEANQKKVEAEKKIQSIEGFLTALIVATTGRNDFKSWKLEGDELTLIENNKPVEESK